MVTPTYTLEGGQTHGHDRVFAVHVAARVAGLATGGEILATAETLAEAGNVAASAKRTAPIKGVTEPVSLAAIAWT